ncbi:MAG: hypothetical protein A2Z99_18495 [Treponema sp. GWB1_62_6]|nr:MAG: hypothetical protein A2Z99_18495 [Treponema sp. GWB1_62_6]OHE76069.1 MAG: hypothetical protein A2413_18350 [Treponema sp. RIFOXYC1_FULL_61_9]
MDYSIESRNFSPSINIAHFLRREEGLSIAPRVIEDFEFVYITEGEGDYILNDRSIRFSAGGLILTPPYLRHAYRPRGGKAMAHYAVHFDPSPGYAGRYKEAAPQDGMESPAPSMRYVDAANGAVVVIPPYIPDLPKSAEGIFIDILARHEETRLESFASASLRLSCSIHELLALIVETCAEPSPRAKNRVAAAAALMDSRYAENLTLPLIAAASRYAPNYFSGEFARAYGLTPMEYLRERRLRRARELLRTGTLSIKEIACLVGIGDQYYFSKVFSARNGLSPSKYRQLSNPDGRSRIQP